MKNKEGRTVAVPNNIFKRRIYGLQSAGIAENAFMLSEKKQANTRSSAGIINNMSESVPEFGT
jgi:hypothetical protein